MQLRTFIAKDMRAALGQVRSEMGPDAVIVASQRAKDGGVVVRAALETEPEQAAEVPAETPETSQTPGPPVELARDFARNYRDELIRRLRSDAPAHASPSPGFNRSELLSLLRGHRAPDALAHQLAEAAEKSGLADMTLALASALDRRMRAAPLMLGDSAALLLVGPSGAGKTAVAAKITAHARLAGRAVRLVAADTAGAGAVARLQAFADHLGVEAATAETAEDVARAVTEAATDHVLTIIDTAGFDPRNARTRTAYAALARLDDVDTLGIVSATGDAEEIAEIAASLDTLGAGRVVVTGLDVARRLGALLSAATQGAALAHITRSPFVSGGLETLTPLSLARLLIESHAGSADRGSPQ